MNKEVIMIKNWNVGNTGRRLFPVLSMMVITILSVNRSESLEQWLQTAYKNNPAIQAAQASVEAKRKDISIARTVPDPTVSAGYFISPVETRVGPQQGKIGLSQMIPWPGKLVQKKKVAQKEYAAAKEELRAAEAKLFADVRGAYAGYYALGREIKITGDNLKLLQQMESVLLSRYAAATAPQVSVLKVQVEMAVLEDRLKSLNAEAHKSREEIYALLNIPAETDLQFPEGLPVLEIKSGADTLLQQALVHNPTLLQARYETEAASDMVGLSRRGFAPDFMVMTDYIFTGKSDNAMIPADENGKDPWVVGASVSIPLWAGNKGARIDKAQAMESMQKSITENIKNITELKASSLLEDYRDAVRKVALYEKTLIPQAKQTITLVEEAYTNAKATILDYLDAQRMLLMLEIALEKQRSRRETIAGKIDMLVGGELTRREYNGLNRRQFTGLSPE